MGRRFLVLCILVLLGVGGYGLWFSLEAKSYATALTIVVDESGQSAIRVFEIPAGGSSRSIGASLEQQGLIVSGEVFARYVRTENKDRALQAGTFYLSPALTIPEVVAVLTGETKLEEERITIREGLRARDIDALLVERGLIAPGAFMECILECSFSIEGIPTSGSLEGYLFPDTYNIVPEQFIVEEFIGRMLQNFARRFDGTMREDVRTSGRTMEEIIIMASIIERESMRDDERPMVADVLWKRYDNREMLGADATLLYEKEDVRSPITYQDLQASSPYNTRRFVGMPPTAISNPGLASLRAALYPTSNEYWYYLHDPTGQIHYGRTLQEHNTNKARYLR